MTAEPLNKWEILKPPFPPQSNAGKIFYSYAKDIEDWCKDVSSEINDLNILTETFLKQTSGLEKEHELIALFNILKDLANQRWQIRTTKAGEVEVSKPNILQFDPQAEKKRIRNQELVKRDEQLKQAATRKFIRMMERRRIYQGEFVSIFSLMRDGYELMTSLRNARSFSMEPRTEKLRKIIDPYLQFISSENDCCSKTGLRLQDIWRYFRHTWSNQYTKPPGRMMAFLVRDRASNYHPIIGIGAIGSPIVQIRERDIWIGWDPKVFLEHIFENPSKEIGKWLIKIVNNAISEIFIDDFLEETYEGSTLLSPSDLQNPSKNLIDNLILYGETQRRIHHRLINASEFKIRQKSSNDAELTDYWRERAKTNLFKSKRALALSQMLNARMIFKTFLGDTPNSAKVFKLISVKQGRKAIKQVLRKAKADRIGISMADITVCGAVPPYNPILGGKLISMLCASPEIVEAYEKRYRSAESEIASSMAGRPIIRPSALVFLGTTSLYGIGSSQYNRVRVPAKRIGGNTKDEISFIELGRSESYGTSHFSEITVKSLVSLVQKSNNGQRVNSIFGEGVSPKLRKIRDGLNLLNLPTDNLLQHGRHRIVYGVSLVQNLREYLLGMDEKPNYIFSEKGIEATRKIADWWIERWLSKRIESDNVLSSVSNNTLISPIRHGARVLLPKKNHEHIQLNLFDDLD